MIIPEIVVAAIVATAAHFEVAIVVSAAHIADFAAFVAAALPVRQNVDPAGHSFVALHLVSE